MSDISSFLQSNWFFLFRTTIEILLLQLYVGNIIYISHILDGIFVCLLLNKSEIVLQDDNVYKIVNELLSLFKEQAAYSMKDGLEHI